jgi:arylsulfatase
MAWLFDPMLTAIGKYEESVKEFPNIPAGAKDFEGYKK